MVLQSLGPKCTLNIGLQCGLLAHDVHSHRAEGFRADADHYLLQEWKTVSKGKSMGEQQAFIDLLRPDAGVREVRTDRLLR